MHGMQSAAAAAVRTGAEVTRSAHESGAAAG